MAEGSTATEAKDKEGLYIVLISVHGLIRGHELELGRDADTGGQTKYVVELARAMARHPDVARVDLLTRRVIDAKVSDDYAEPEEKLSDDNAYLIRLPAGPRRYLRKEVLWPHLDAMADEALLHFRRIGQSPDLIHSHYADAGYVGVRLSQLLAAPLIHTGHSLGVDKRMQLLEKGVKPENIEKQYNMSTRIEAEEIVLGNASMVVASTSQEVEEQYARYDNYHPQRMKVIPPGIDLQRFYPPGKGYKTPAFAEEINRFLHKPKRPLILALSRADERKNIATLVHAYANTEGLREMANLAIIAGNRDDISTMDKGQRRVLTELLRLIDYYDLYGHVAYPKHHSADDVPQVYRLTRRTRGLFVNPALVEPFGLTLIEAAATGLPLVATKNGGPQDIIANCKNGLLVDPNDAEEMGKAIRSALEDSKRWSRWSRSGIRGTKQHYTWEGHVEKYLREAEKVIRRHKRTIQKRSGRPPRLRLPSIDRLLICDIDNTLIGDQDGVRELFDRIQSSPAKVGFAVATGRKLNSALKVLKEWDIPVPDLIISSVGSEIHYGNGLVKDDGWEQHIDYLWKPDELREAMTELPGLKLQPKREQLKYKLSYYTDGDNPPNHQTIRSHLRHLDLHCKLIYTQNHYIDLLPLRASKGLAIRFLMMRWGLEPDHIMVAGDAGNDIEMLRGDPLGVVVGNYSPELEQLRGEPRIYFASDEYARGIIEGIDHYDFLGDPHYREDGEEERQGAVEETIT